MTLKVCCSNIFSIIKRQIWLPALWFAIFFFALPVQTALLLQFTRREVFSPAVRASENLAAIFGPQSNILVWLLMLMAFISALVYGGYMHRQKQVDFYHSQPISRGRLLLQNAAAGLLTLFIPYLANVLLTLIVALAMGMGAMFPWAAFFGGLAVHALYVTAIFATALIAVVISGKGAVAGISGLFLLGVLPALLGLTLAAANEFYPTFYSDLYDWGFILRWLSPAAAYVIIPWNGPPYGLPLILLYGALAFIAALALYRRRGSEAAGQAIAFKTARPLLKYALACLVATLFALIFHGIGDYGDGYFWLYFGAVTGGFLATQITEIVYALDFRAVFRHLRGLALFLLIFLALLTCVVNDISGFNTALPPADQVASVEIHLTGVNRYVYDSMGFSFMYQGQSLEERRFLERGERDHLAMGPVTSPAAIEAALDIAARFANTYLPPTRQQPAVGAEQPEAWRRQGKQYLLDYLDENYDSYGLGYINLNNTSFSVVFTLKNGRTMARDYRYNDLPVQFLLEDIAVIYGQEDFRAAQLRELMFPDEYYAPDSLELFELYYGLPLADWMTAQDNRAELLAALRADLLELSVAEQQQSMPIGALGLRLYAEPVTYPLDKDWLDKDWHESYDHPYSRQSWPIYASFSRTLAFLAKMGYGPELTQPQLEDIISVNIMDNYADYYRLETYGYAPAATGPIMPQPVYDRYYDEIISYKMPHPAYGADGEHKEITDPADIAKIMAQSYPYQAVGYNCFIDINSRLEVQVSYRGPGGQVYVTTRALPY